MAAPVRFAEMPDFPLHRRRRPYMALSGHSRHRNNLVAIGQKRTLGSAIKTNIWLARPHISNLISMISTGTKPECCRVIGLLVVLCAVIVSLMGPMRVELPQWRGL